MLTYSISRHSAPHKAATANNYLSKSHILARQLAGCKVKVGDLVRPTTGKRAGKYGTVLELIADPEKVEWYKGGKQPYFVAVAFTDGANDHVAVLNYPVKQLRKPR